MVFMKKKETSPLQKYLDEVKNYLKPVIPVNRNFLYALKRDLEEYLATHPDSCFEDFVEYFGSPESVAMQQLDELEEKDIRQIAKRKKIKTLCLILLLFFLLASIGYIIYLSTFAQGTGTLTLEVSTPEYIDDSVLE